MKKRVLSICLILAMLLSLPLAVFADEAAAGTGTTDYDAEAVTKGYQARVGTAEEAYDGGKFTGYFKFGEITKNSGRDGTLDLEGGIVPSGATVTLIADVTSKVEYSMRNQFTLDGNGKTMTGAGWRLADDNGDETLLANVTVKNLILHSTKTYVMQVNAGHSITMQGCTLVMDEQPAYGMFVARGNITLEDCTVSCNYKETGTSYYGIFFVDQATGVITLRDCELTLPAGSAAAVAYVSGASTINVYGKTKMVNGALKLRNAKAICNIHDTISETDVKLDNKDGTNGTINRISVWDGKTCDISWYKAGTLEYTLDTAAKVAGLAKLCADAKTADYPSKGESALVTFYITCDIDLEGHAWTPIGVTYGYRFQGHIIGKKGGVEGAAITVYNMSVTAGNEANMGFIGTVDDGSTVSNLTFIDPVVDGLGQNTVGVVLGYARGQANGKGVKLSNLTVQNASVVSKGQWVGGIVAYAKYKSVDITNCTFTGNIYAQAGSMVGGIIGNAQTGTTMTNCYAGGTIYAAAKQVGGMIGYLDAGTTTTMTDCQMDMLVSGVGESGTGALIGEIANASDKTTALNLTRVLVSGIAFEKTTPANAFAVIGLVSGSGNLTVTAQNCVTAAKLALYGVKKATVSGDVAGISSPAFADMISTEDGKGVALLGGTAYTKGANNYPVLASAKNLVADTYGYADYAWIDLSKTEMEISSAYQLVGFSNAVKAYNFADKTVKLAADIDGSNIPAKLVLGNDGTIGLLTASFVGKFDKNGHAITKMTFSAGGEVKFTVVWNWDNGNENDNITEEYQYGETPEYKGDTPTKANDDKYSYAFYGWDKKVAAVDADVVYTAIYRKTKLEKETEPESSEVTTGAPVTEAPTAEAPAAQSSESCKSSVAGVFFPLCLALAGAAVMKKRRED